MYAIRSYYVKKICSTARVTEVDGKRIVKVGGLKNYDGKKYVILFLYDDPTDGQLGILIVGQNQNGFTLSFAQEKETVLDVEFKASSQDNEGTLVQLVEDIEEVFKTLTVTSIAGSSTGTTKISVMPILTSGRTYVYKTALSIVAPVLNDTLNDWLVWDGTSEIIATTGNKIGIAEIDASLNCKGYGFATVTSKT